jgi:hypothetical protein
MVVGFTTTCAISAYHHQSFEFEPCSLRGVLDTTFYDKVCRIIIATAYMCILNVFYFSLALCVIVQSLINKSNVSMMLA